LKPTERAAKTGKTGKKNGSPQRHRKHRELRILKVELRNCVAVPLFCGLTPGKRELRIDVGRE
jgi:hypothetical protein